MKRLSLLLLCLLAYVAVYAVPAYPGVVHVTQPDGTDLAVLLHGDESFHYMTTEDGYLLAVAETGFYEYAVFDGQTHVRTLGQQANNVGARSYAERKFVRGLDRMPAQLVKNGRLKSSNAAPSAPMRFPQSGSPKSLVILVEFSNLSFKIANLQQAFTNLLNKAGYSDYGGTGSARDYFIAVSDSAFQPEFVVVGPVKLDHPYNYYGGNDASGSDKAARQMIIDACRKADTLGVDFSEYDTNGDGYVDNVFVYYAGYNEAEGAPAETVWPHRWVVQPTLRIDGVVIYDYACTSELRGNSGATMCGIGTFCHEFTHVFGLPDLYVTDYNDGGRGLGKWDIMASGSYNNNGCTPPAFSAYERFFVGWLTPTVLSESALVTLGELNSSNQAYLLTKTRSHNLNGVSPNPTQFFLLENRQKKGWDAYLPGKGMLVTRINYSASRWQQNTVNNDTATLGVAIIGANASTTGTASDTYPGSYNVTSFLPKLNDGMSLEQPLTYITERNGVVEFRYDGGGDGFPMYEAFPQALPQFGTVQAVPSDSQIVSIEGKWLVDDLKVSLKSGENFQIATQDDVSWTNAVVFKPAADSTLYAQLFVRYFPENASFSDTHRDTIAIVLDKYTTYCVALSGKSTRPVLVEIPVATEATDTTSSAYTAAWEEAFDATGYYLSAYSVDSAGTSVLAEEFDAFDAQPSVDWQTSFSIVNASVFGQNAPSVVFDSDADTLVSERYCFPVTKISFWMHSMGASGSVLCVDGYANGEWTRIDSIVVDKTMLRSTQEMPLPAGNAMSRFRITYQKKAGKVLFDDFTVHFSQKVDFQCHHTHVTGLRQQVEGLMPDREYRYRVQATDKTEHYENITDFSNEIGVYTLPAFDTDSRRLTVGMTDAGTYEVQLEELKENYHLYIYTLDGRLLADIIPQNQTIEIPVLPTNVLYVLKYTSVNDRSRKDPSAKLFYQSLK